MDPFTLALATFGIQKLRGKSSKRSLRDALLAGGIGQFAGTMGMPGMQTFGQGTASSLPGATLGAQLRHTGAATMALGAPQAATTAPAIGSTAHAKLQSIPAIGETTKAAALPKPGGGIRGWWDKLGTAEKIGYGSAAVVGGGALLGDDDEFKFDETPYKEAYARQSKLTSGLSKRASYGSEPLYSTQNLYSYKTGGLASLPVQKYAQGGVSFMPSKMTHNDKDYNNYIKADGYIEDGSGAGSKNKDTILAQLADGEFVSRTDAILGAGLIEGASPKDEKEMRRKGADFFYKQQAKFKRIFDLLNAGTQRTN